MGSIVSVITNKTLSNIQRHISLTVSIIFQIKQLVLNVIIFVQYIYCNSNSCGDIYIMIIIDNFGPTYYWHGLKPKHQHLMN